MTFFPVTYDDFTTELAIGIQPTLWQELRFGARYSTGDIELSTLLLLVNWILNVVACLPTIA